MPIDFTSLDFLQILQEIDTSHPTIPRRHQLYRALHVQAISRGYLHVLQHPTVVSNHEGFREYLEIHKRRRAMAYPDIR